MNNYLEKCGERRNTTFEVEDIGGSQEQEGFQRIGRGRSRKRKREERRTRKTKRNRGEIIRRKRGKRRRNIN